MKRPAYSIAVVGATGLVGQEIIEQLALRGFPIGSLQVYASLRTAGELIRCGEVTARIDPLDGARFEGTDIVVFAAAEQVSAEWVARATQAGAVVIDTSQLFSADTDVPVVVPEVNADSLAGYTDRGIVASPDTAAIALSIVLKPLHDVAGLTRVVATTFEPVSGAGRTGIEELQDQTVELMSGRSVEPAVFPRRIAFNLVPQVGEFLAGGAARGEEQTMRALRRLLNAPDVEVSVTRVHAPVFYGAALSLSVGTVERVSADAVRELWRAAPGILLQDDAAAGVYPTPADTVGQDAVCVGRIRVDEGAGVVDSWVVLDNLRKGSATNAVQIAELLIRDHL